MFGQKNSYYILILFKQHSSKCVFGGIVLVQNKPLSWFIWIWHMTTYDPHSPLHLIWSRHSRHVTVCTGFTFGLHEHECSSPVCIVHFVCFVFVCWYIVVLYAITRALQLNNSLIIQMMPSSCKIPPEQSWSLALRWWRLPWGHSLRMQQMTWRKHWRTWSLGSSRTHAARWRVCHRTSTTPQLPCCPSSLLCLSTSLSISSEWTFCVSKALYMLSSIMEKLNALSWRTYGLLLVYHYCFFFLILHLSLACL